MRPLVRAEDWDDQIPESGVLYRFLAGQFVDLDGAYQLTVSGKFSMEQSTGGAGGSPPALAPQGVIAVNGTFTLASTEDHGSLWFHRVPSSPIPAESAPELEHPGDYVDPEFRRFQDWAMQLGLVQSLPAQGASEGNPGPTEDESEFYDDDWTEEDDYFPVDSFSLVKDAPPPVAEEPQQEASPGETVQAVEADREAEQPPVDTPPLDGV